jgi:hypothetical protein
MSKLRLLNTELRRVTTKKSKDLVIVSVVYATVCGYLKTACRFTRTFLRDFTGGIVRCLL